MSSGLSGIASRLLLALTGGLALVFGCVQIDERLAVPVEEGDGGSGAVGKAGSTAKGGNKPSSGGSAQGGVGVAGSSAQGGSGVVTPTGDKAREVMIGGHRAVVFSDFEPWNAMPNWCGYFFDVPLQIEGGWFAYNDETLGAVQSPAAGPDAIFACAMSDDPARGKFVGRTQGSGFTDWGAGIGLTLQTNYRPGFKSPLGNAACVGSVPCPIDISGFVGVGFWAKGQVDQLDVLLVDANTQTTEFGGNCEPSATNVCNDAYRFIIPGTAIGDDWTPIVTLFADYAQLGYGAVFPAPDLTQMMDLNFAVPPDAPFDLYIDDIALIAN